MSLVLLLLGIFFIVKISSIAGIVLIATSLIVSINGSKKKSLLDSIVLVLDIAVCIFIGVTLYIGTKQVIQTNSTVNERVYRLYSSELESRAREYVETERLWGREVTIPLILTKNEIDYKVSSDCEYYVKYDGETKAYIRCKDYVTEGFDESNLK